jgi:hypothetical protein
MSILIIGMGHEKHVGFLLVILTTSLGHEKHVIFFIGNFD